jgi:hypothetical protein
MNLVKDLLGRVFLHYKSSLEGVGFIAVAFLADHGFNLSAENSELLVAKIVAYGVGLVKLFWKDADGPTDPPADGGVIGSSVYRSLLLVGLLVVAGSAFKCGGGADPQSLERNIVAAGYDVHLGFEAAANSAKAFNARGRLADEKYKTVITKLSGLTEAAQRFNLRLDQIPQITPGNKQEVIDLIDGFLADVDSVVADELIVDADKDTQSQVRRWIFVARAVGQGIKVAVAAVQQPTEPAKVLIDPASIKGASDKARSRDFTDNDAALVQDLINISTDFLVDVLAQRGQSIETIRTWRNDLYNTLKAFYAAELARFPV